jgi:hypothetical protein
VTALYACNQSPKHFTTQHRAKMLERAACGRGTCDQPAGGRTFTHRDHQESGCQQCRCKVLALEYLRHGNRAASGSALCAGRWPTKGVSGHTRAALRSKPSYQHQHVPLRIGGNKVVCMLIQQACLE